MYQIARNNAIKAEFIKQAEREAKEKRKSGELLSQGVVGLGLIKKDKGEKDAESK